MVKHQPFYFLLLFGLLAGSEISAAPLKAGSSNRTSSVLATGTWLKMALANPGIYRITHEDLVNAGISADALDPRNIRIFGNGGGMLPESNASPRTDDLREISIFVYGEEDGRFDAGDYILFYGESPGTWTYNTSDNLYHHINNIYSDYCCYFLTFDNGAGKRVTSESSTTLPATHYVSKFNEHLSYEKDDSNLLKSGKEWYDQDIYDVTTTRSCSFSLPNLDPSFPVTILTDVAARSTSGSSSFRISANGEQIAIISVQSVSGDYLDTFAKKKSGSGYISTGSPVISVTIEYLKSYSGQTGYLNYIEVNAFRKLIMTGNQMLFRSVYGSGEDRVSEFTLTSQGQNLVIWDVSDGGDVRKINASVTDNLYIFRLPTETVREFIAFDGGSFNTPDFIGFVPHQDLHGTDPVDYVIVSHSLFLNEAERLAAFHRTKNNLSVLVTTPEKVYNEFSSGVQDITAIRDFMKMLYDRSDPGSRPKYLLLFGDASYDYKSRVTNNTNFIPSFESSESLHPVESYVTDDYYVILGSSDGLNGAGDLCAGVGRLPVTSAEEATQAINKIIHYCSNNDSVKNDWRTTVCFVADDQDEGGNTFINDSEELAAYLGAKYPVFNRDKIYLDAYAQVSTPGGNRYPEVNEAINKRVEKGALIVNYIGHGGEVGWSHERVLEVADITGWRNFNNMPVFMTATCEFSRFDDPARVSAGEYVFLNASGGGIALFTTTRATYAGSNMILCSNFYQSAFQRINGQYMRLGDIIMLAKNKTGANSNVRKFVLLGDPALQMAYPDLNVATTSIYTNASVKAYDTIKALAEVTIEGEIRDLEGAPVPAFNGTIFPTVLDKPSEIYTRGNDGGDPVRFFLYRNPLYKGQVKVENGIFSFTFIVPKDIAYQYGNGRISYYARNESTDAAGFDTGFIVGGYNNNAVPDENGPVLSLFLNDRNFRSGGITDPMPSLLSDVSDESGINTVGNGIGHDITAILDEQTTVPMILNEYYVADLNTYKSGVITYPLGTLEEGEHTLTLKVWDVFNNSSEASIQFIVSSLENIELQDLVNYPNPFRDYTTFSFGINRALMELGVEIRIYSLYGELLRTINKDIYASGYRIEPVQWDGTTDDGPKVGSGTYIYTLKVTLPDGSSVAESAKMVVIR